MNPALRVPCSTYRLQFHGGFTFRAACGIIPYLQKLGVSDCYASPYLKARPGSKHGYDISDHRAINPEVGTEEDCLAWADTLRAHGMGQVLDIVPNHMGIVGNENPWWNDILENGPCAKHAGFFDIDWQPLKPDLRGKVMLCILGEPYGKVLESGKITVSFANGSFIIHYFDHRFPVAPETALALLRLRLEDLEHALGKEAPEFMEYQSVLTALAHLPGRNDTDAARVEERYREKEVIRRRLDAMVQASAPVRKFVERNVAIFNGAKGDRHSFDLLDDLLAQQAYRLAYWQVAADEINYRRFFDVNELAALSMEKPEVFDATHELILRLIAAGAVTGLRVDHPDGLFDPRLYFETLQRRIQALGAAAAGDDSHEKGPVQVVSFVAAETFHGEPPRRSFYVLAEKILGRDECLPEDWPIHGTTGYEFLNHVNGLFVARANESAFSRIYERWTGLASELGPYVHDKKFLILQVAMSGELHVLAQQLDRLSEKDRWSRDFTLNSLRHALREIIACFPVYRSYITDTVTERDRKNIEVAVAQAKRRNPLISNSIFHFIRDTVLLRYADHSEEPDRAAQRRFVGKFQQVTAPVMAKGLEDTAFYVFNRLISLNEVGGDPGRFGIDPASLHAFLQSRQQDWPLALSASSTHDTKRSEDVRARINVLTELPGDWQKALSRWNRLNKRHRVQVDGSDAPDRNDEYLLYQTLIGAWPLGNTEPAVFVERIANYMTKAAHEAKVHTSWTNPNPAYDEAVRRFVTRILDERQSGMFLTSFRALQQRVSHFGLFNSLAQLVVKIAAPGIPDIYQGTEIWDFSLVDPDNRRPVDYQARESMLADLGARVAAGGDDLRELARELMEQKEDGRIKLYVTWQGLQCRCAKAELFTEGEYLPLATEGDRSNNVFAFARRHQQDEIIVVVPRLLTGLVSGPPDLPVGKEVWRDTSIVLPEGARPMRYQNIFTKDVLNPGAEWPRVQMADILANFPMALLKAMT